MFVKLYKFVIQQFQNQKNAFDFLNPKIRRLDFPNLYTNEIRNFQNLKFRKSKFSRSRIPHLTAKEQCADMRDVLPLDKLTELTFFEEEIVKAMDGPDGIIERLQGYCCELSDELRQTRLSKSLMPQISNVAGILRVSLAVYSHVRPQASK